MQRFPARPFVSFCLATYNRGQVLLDCLQKTLATARASLGESHFNIKVVDNASTDDTAERLAAFAQHQRHITLTRLPKNCGPVAKNIVLHQNAADILVLLDDDAFPQPGALAQMVRHFQDDPHLAAAVFDVTLPDGRKEASAYPDVFIGAGTALRGTALRALADPTRTGRGLLPADFFMQAEEYDLSFRLLAQGWSIQRFWDMPLIHLKSPGARVGTRTTRLDVRNNLWILARYLPAPLCTQLAADWLARYWRMALARDAATASTSHKAAFLRGAAEGLRHWSAQRRSDPLPEETLERIFKFHTIRDRLARAKKQLGLRRIVFGDWGKNLLPFYRAARDLDLQILAIVDPQLAPSPTASADYRGIPLVDLSTFRQNFENRTDALLLTQISRIHAERRSAEFRRTVHTPVLDLFSRALPQKNAPLAAAFTP